MTVWSDFRLSEKHTVCSVGTHNISDVSQLADVITKTNEEFYKTSNEIKDTDRRMNTLKLHLAHNNTAATTISGCRGNPL